MNREHQLAYCRVCAKRKMDMQKGLLCSLTNDYAQFTETCPSFEHDKANLNAEGHHTGYPVSSAAYRASNNASAGKLWAGIGLMVGGIVLFIVGIALDRIIFWSIFLFIAGIVSIATHKPKPINEAAAQVNPQLRMQQQVPNTYTPNPNTGYKPPLPNQAPSTPPPPPSGNPGPPPVNS